MMGITLPGSPSVAQHIADGQRLATAIRGESRRDVRVLESIQQQLDQRGITRHLVRIFDAILWYSQPTASVPPSRREISIRLHV